MQRVFVTVTSNGLTLLPLRIMLQIIEKTARPDGYKWADYTVQYLAMKCGGTISDTGKALRQLERPKAEGGYELLRAKKAGKLKLYQPIAENFGTVPGMKPRTCRKPPQSETTFHEVEKMEVAETVEVTESISAMDREVSKPIPAKSRVELGETPPVMNATPIRELADFCIETITPKLGTCPEEKFVAQAVKVLGDCPTERLKSRILQRINNVTSWAILPLLAEDVRKAHVELKRVTESRGPAQYDLTADWSSATKIRRLYSSGDTPQAVKQEIVHMWPELRTGPLKKSKIEQLLDSAR